MADDINPELQRHIEALERKNKLLEEGLHQAERLRQMFDRTAQELTASKSLLIRQAAELEKKAREFKLVMETLIESGTRFRMAFQNAAIGMALVGLDGHWLKVNNSLCQIVGYSEPELLKKTFHDITHPDDQKTDIDLVAKLLAGELDHYQMEKRYFHKDGHVIWIRLSVSLIRDAKDNPIYFVAQTEDITEGKLAAEAVRRANVELSLFHKLLDNSSDAIEVLDPITLRFLDVNEKACRDLGYSREELLSMSAFDIDPAISADSRKMIEAQIQKSGTARFEGLHLRKDGSTFPVEVSATFIEIDKPYMLSIARDITERKKLELDKEQYLKFFMLSLNPMCIADPYGCLRKVNPAFVQFTGYSESELIAKPFLEFVLPEDRQRTEDEMKLQVESRPTLHFDNRYLCKNGTVIDLSWTAYYDKHDGTSYATAIDITERKQMEGVLRKSEAEFRTLAEAMPQIIWITRPDGWNIYVNQQWMDYTGLTLEESLGHGWNKPFHPDDQKRAWDAWQQATTTKGIYSIESRLRCADGIYRWWLVRGVPLQDADGNILKWFGTCTDINDIKMTELEISRINLELRESERRFSDMLKNVELVSVMRDSEERITYCNEFLLRLTGWKYEEIIGRNWVEFFVPPEIAKQKKKVFAELLLNKPEAMHYESEILTRSGERRLIHWNNSVLRSGDGDVIGTASIGENITERKRMEETLKNMAAKFHTVFESSADAIMLFDGNGFIECNEATLRLFGCHTRADFISKHPVELSPPTQPGGKDSMSLANEHIATAFKNGSNRVEWIHRRLDGTEFLAEVSLTALELDGKPVLQATVRDITARVRSQSQLLEQLDELRRWHEVTSGREARILDLKHEVNDLLSQTGKDPRYPSAE